MDSENNQPSNEDNTTPFSTDPKRKKRKGRGSTRRPNIIKDRSSGVRKVIHYDSEHNQPSNEDNTTPFSTDPKRKKRKGRGSTRLPNVIKDRSSGVRKVIHYNSENNQPSNEDNTAPFLTDPKRKKRKGRGSTRLPNVIKDRSSGVRKVIHYDDIGRPTGINRPQFASYLGVLARTMVPIDHKDWFEVPEHIKDKLWKMVQEAFIVDPRSRKKVLSSIASCLRTFRKTLTTYIYNYKSDPVILSKPPKAYSFLEQTHWDSFVKRRLAEGFEEFRDMQRERRAGNIYDHRVGRKGYSGLQEEIVAKSPVPVENVERSYMWKRARQNKDGEYDNIEIKKKAAKIDEITKHVEDGTIQTQGSDDVLTMALGGTEHSGRVRGVGGTVTPSIYFQLPRRGNHSSFFEIANEVASKKPAMIGNQRALKHHGVVGRGVVDEATSKNLEWEKNLESIALFTIFAENTPKEVATKIPLEKDIFGAEVEAHLQKVDMEYICQMTEVSATCIMLYIRQLYRGIKASNMDRRFTFVNPCLLSGRMVSVSLKPGLLAQRLAEVKKDQLLFVPCNPGFHWVLCVIDLFSESSPTVYLMDSINYDFSLSLKLLINTAFAIYDKTKGRRIPIIPTLKVVECPKQTTSVECGLYVMKYMKDVIREERILSSGNFNGKRTYTEAEIDEVRVDWINSVVN